MESEPKWDWSALDIDSAHATGTDQDQRPQPASRPSDTPSDPSTKESVHPATPPPEAPPATATPRQSRKQRHYGPRTCRICLETELPKYPEATSTLGIASASSRPVYVSDDPDLGRLLSPCKCKGSQKYVHEGCLDAWRLSNPNATRNYWQCPTCKFTYRMSRLHWAAALSNKFTQVILTVLFMIIGLFLLGCIADPIIDLWLDPVGTIADSVSNLVTDIEAKEEPVYYYEPFTWAEHFLKGFLSLGLIGFLKTMFLMTSWDFFSFRTFGMARGGGRRVGNTGRARMDSTNLVLVIIGATTFLMATWKAVKAISARVLKRVSDRVMDVGDDDDGEDT